MGLALEGICQVERVREIHRTCTQMGAQKSQVSILIRILKINVSNPFFPFLVHTMATVMGTSF